MLRYRVMLTGPRRESRGKVRVSPEWLPQACLIWPLVSSTVLLWLARCPCALPSFFPLLPFSRIFILIPCPCYFTPFAYSLFSSWIGAECHDWSWIASRLRILGKRHLVCRAFVAPCSGRGDCWESGQTGAVDRPYQPPSAAREALCH